jgi:hypothetical protein
MRVEERQTRASGRSWIPGCLFLAAALVATACSDNEPNLVGTAQQAEFEADCSGALAGIPEAQGAEIEAIEREREGGIDVWGVELSNGVEIEFASGEGGCRVLEIEHGDDDAGGDDDDDGEDDD